jgi:hypothetical protein
MILKNGNRILKNGQRVFKNTGSAVVLPSFPAVIPQWYCKFDNNVNDSAGGNNGANVGAVSYPTGLINQGIQYTPANNYTSFSPLGITGVQPWTFCCWVKCTGNTEKGVIGFGQEAGGRAMFGYIRNGLVYLDYYGSGVYLQSTSTVTSGTLRHIAYKFDGARSYLYVDGLLEASDNTYIPNLGNSYFFLGKVYSGSSSVTMNGLMDEGYFFNSSLSDADILAIKTAGDAGVTYN